MTPTPHILTPISTQYPRLVTRLNAQRQTVLRLPITVRWILFLAAYTSLMFGGVVLMAFFLVENPKMPQHHIPMFAASAASHDSFHAGAAPFATAR